MKAAAPVAEVAAVLPQRGHAWLVDKTQAEAIHVWLKRIAAGELPSEGEAPEPKIPVPDPSGKQPIKVIDKGRRQHESSIRL